jgi:hypothetical protein
MQILRAGYAASPSPKGIFVTAAQLERRNETLEVGKSLQSFFA